MKLRKKQVKNQKEQVQKRIDSPYFFVILQKQTTVKELQLKRKL